MKRRGATLGVITAVLLLFCSGCVVAERPGYGGRGTYYYYYYPDHEVYYYPRAQRYYWLDRGEWRNGPQPPSRFALSDRARVRIESDHEPPTEHDRIKRQYPPGHYDSQERQEQRNEDRRDNR
ncbi:MAG TPA: hypothetical protein VF905_01315 [Nitrospirota bacterium]